MTHVSAGMLVLDLGGMPNAVMARREGEVPDGFWSLLRLEWGFDGHPDRAIRVPLPQFLTHLDWLKPACQRYRVGLRWDDGLVELLRRNRGERREVDALLSMPAGFSAEEVAARLSGTRFRRLLRPFQVRDVGRLLALAHGANFSVPGAGKTTVAYAVYEAERHAGRVSRMLVVAPISAFDAWRREIGECFGDQPELVTFTGRAKATAEILLVNYHRLASSYEELAEWVQSGHTLVLLDEAHRMKAGRSGQHGSACLDLAFLARRRDILTGTPAPQAPTDFVALLDYVWPGQASRILPPDALVSHPADAAVHRVARAIRPLYVRTRKGELGLDPPVMRVRPVPLDGLHAAIYQALRDRYAGELRVSMTDRSELARMGAVTMYLLEAATNPHLLAAGSAAEDRLEFRHPPLEVEPGSRLWDLIQRYNQYETPAKFGVLASIVEQNARCGRKTLIWSNFVRNLRALERMFARYEPALIYGAVPAESEAAATAERTREGELARFRSDPACRVLLANPAAMSEGVSLHYVCHDAIYLERTFNAGQFLQSVDRIHRLGLPPGTTTSLTFLVTSGTIDEVVDQRIQVKAERLGAMLDDPDLAALALPDEEDYGQALDSAEDLAALFAHLRGEGGA